MTRRFLAFALAFLLGLAQHAALAHAIAHHAPLTHDGARLAQDHDPALPALPEGVHADCALDALYVQVLGGAGVFAVSSLPFVAPREPAVATDFLSALPAAVLAAAPRGPPAATPPL